jgi:hypothetical protein
VVLRVFGVADLRIAITDVFAGEGLLMLRQEEVLTMIDAVPEPASTLIAAALSPVHVEANSGRCSGRIMVRASC